VCDHTRDAGIGKGGGRKKKKGLLMPWGGEANGKFVRPLSEPYREVVQMVCRGKKERFPSVWEEYLVEVVRMPVHVGLAGLNMQKFKQNGKRESRRKPGVIRI